MELTQDFIDALFGSDANLQLADPSLVQYYHDLANRSIWIDGEINVSTLDIVSKIIRWNREEKGKPIDERKPIKLFFLSPGGDLEIEEAVVSTIRLSQTPVWGIAMGMVASAASLIYLSCHKRFALPNAYLIIHQGSAQMGGNYDQMVAAMKDYEEQIERMTKFYIENTDYTEDEIRTNIKTDWYVRGEELLERKLITNWVSTIDELL
jgi:ATP-dependent protease ClpP protease subunit